MVDLRCFIRLPFFPYKECFLSQQECDEACSDHHSLLHKGFNTKKRMALFLKKGYAVSILL